MTVKKIILVGRLLFFPFSPQAFHHINYFPPKVPCLENPGGVARPIALKAGGIYNNTAKIDLVEPGISWYFVYWVDHQIKSM